MNKFIPKKVPVHSFYLDYAKDFRAISDSTGGKAAPFNLKSPKVSNELTSFIVEQILAIIQQR